MSGVECFLYIIYLVGFLFIYLFLFQKHLTVRQEFAANFFTENSILDVWKFGRLSVSADCSKLSCFS